MIIQYGWTQNRSASTYLSGQMLFPQSRQSRHDIRRERVVRQLMSDPSQHSCSKLKRTSRYLKRGRQWIQVFAFGDMSSEVTVFFSDSDWAGDRETRKSSSAGVALAGRHFSKACTRNKRLSPEAALKQNCMQQHWKHQKRKSSRA